jgi:hypothetical protein
MKEKVVHGKLAEQAIESLKNAHGRVYEVIIPIDDEGAEHVAAYLKKPSRQALGKVMGIMNSNPVKANEILLADCWVGGDDRAKTDDEAFLSLCEAMGDLITVRKAEIEKK